MKPIDPSAAVASSSLREATGPSVPVAAIQHAIQLIESERAAVASRHGGTSPETDDLDDHARCLRDLIASPRTAADLSEAPRRYTPVINDGEAEMIDTRFGEWIHVDDLPRAAALSQTPGASDPSPQEIPDGLECLACRQQGWHASGCENAPNGSVNAPR